MTVVPWQSNVLLLCNTSNAGVVLHRVVFFITKEVNILLTSFFITKKVCFDQYELDYLERILFLHVEMPHCTA